MKNDKLNDFFTYKMTESVNKFEDDFEADYDDGDDFEADDDFEDYDNNFEGDDDFEINDF